MSLLGRGFTYTDETLLPDGTLIIGQPVHNLLPQEFIDHMASLALGAGAAPISAWYVFLFEGNYVPDASIKATELVSLVGECVAYSEATRPAWSGTYDGVSILDNLDAKAVFTMTANKTIYGAGIISVSAKGGATGLLMSIARYDEPRILTSGSQFSVGIGSVLASGA